MPGKDLGTATTGFPVKQLPELIRQPVTELDNRRACGFPAMRPLAQQTRLNGEDSLVTALQHARFGVSELVAPTVTCAGRKRREPLFTCHQRWALKHPGRRDGLNQPVQIDVFRCRA